MDINDTVVHRDGHIGVVLSLGDVYARVRWVHVLSGVFPSPSSMVLLSDIGPLTGVKS